MRKPYDWLEKPSVKEWAEEQKKFREMHPEEYRKRLTDLIDHAGSELSDEDSNGVLLEAFLLIKERLGIRIEAQLVLPRLSTDAVRRPAPNKAMAGVSARKLLREHGDAL